MANSLNLSVTFKLIKIWRTLEISHVPLEISHIPLGQVRNHCSKCKKSVHVSHPFQRKFNLKQIYILINLKTKVVLDPSISYSFFEIQIQKQLTYRKWVIWHCPDTQLQDNSQDSWCPQVRSWEWLHCLRKREKCMFIIV